jgi:hypothetical protein
MVHFETSRFSRLPTPPQKATGPLAPEKPAIPGENTDPAPLATPSSQPTAPVEQTDFGQYAATPLTPQLFEFPDKTALTDCPDPNTPLFESPEIVPFTLDLPTPQNPLTLPMSPALPKINTEHPILRQLNQASMRGGRNHSCVETVLTNLDRLGVKTFNGGTTDDRNNPRGAMVQMLKAGNWTSVDLPGSSERTIKSPAYGNAKAHVLPANAYLKLAREGKIPNGAVVFQTQHGWGYSGGSRGNDMGIVRNGQIFNYANMGSMNVYGNGL